MRYRGQAYEIPIPFAPDYPEAFHRAHAKLYGYANPARATEIVQLRVTAIGRTDKPAPSVAAAHDLALPPPTAIRPAIFRRRPVPTPIYRRDRLAPGMGGPGPAIILTGQSTNVITPAFSWVIDPAGTLKATRNP
jgi:N-methylhydantoinase A